MIAIAMASSCGTGSEREWFDRAVAAHFDYADPYNSLFWALRPRWGGSHQEMYAFGLECLNTKRFDTCVPTFFSTVLKDIREELDDWRDAYRAPGVYDNYKIFCEGMMAEPSRANAKIGWNSRLAMIAWLTGHYDDAQRIFDELGDTLKDYAFTDFSCDKKAALAETRLMTGPHKEEFSKAELLYHQGEFLAAAPLYEVLRNKVKEESLLYFIDERLVMLRINSKYEEGEWADLSPDESMHGWMPLSGEWSADKKDGALCGATTGKEKTIMSLHKTTFHGDYELRGEIDAKYIAGIILGSNNDTFLTLHINKLRKSLTLARKFYAPTITKEAEGLPVKYQFHITVRDGKLSVIVDGKQFFADEPIKSRWWNPRAGQIGVGESFGPYAGHIIKYRNLQIRKLPKQPPTIAS